MGKLDPRELEISLLDMIKYDAIKDKQSWIWKDKGNYVQVLVPQDNDKLHDTFEVYYGSDGHICKIIGHDTNTTFRGTQYFRNGKRVDNP